MNSTIAFIIIGVSVLFILGIKFLSSPKSARTGNLVAAAGMIIALLVLHKTDGTSVWTHGWNFNYTLIVIGTVIGLIIGAIGAYSVKMTAMPQMVAMFKASAAARRHSWRAWNLCAARTASKASRRSSPVPCYSP